MSCRLATAERLPRAVQFADRALNVGRGAILAREAFGQGEYGWGNVYVGFSLVGLGSGADSLLRIRKLGLGADYDSLRLTRSAAVDAGRAETRVSWVDEGGDLREGRSPGMSPAAYRHQSSAAGASDRKLNPYSSLKAVAHANRQAAVARHFGLQAVWELPTPEAVGAAIRFLQTHDITGIIVRQAP